MRHPFDSFEITFSPKKNGYLTQMLAAQFNTKKPSAAAHRPENHRRRLCKASFALCLAAFALLLPQSVFAIKNYALGDELNVLALKGLNLRAAPNGQKVVQTIPYGGKVVIAEQPNQNYPFEADGIKGFWIKVQVGEKTTGYVFDGFLSFLPAPALDCGSFEAYAKKSLKTLTPKTVQQFTAWDENPGFSREWVQFFSYKNLQIALVERSGSFGPSQVYLTLSGVSMEEAWLIARVCLSAELEKAKAALPPDAKDDRGEKVLPVHYETFKSPFYEAQGCMAWQLAEENQFLGINETDGASLLRFTLPGQ